MNRWQLIALFAVIHGLIFMILYEGAFPGHVEIDSRPLYLHYASNIFDGQLPYQDFAIEYAPFSLVFFLLPRIFADTGSEYHVAFAIEMLVFDLAGLLLIASIATRLNLPPWKPLLAYTLFLLAIGPIITDHFDLAAAVLTLLSLYAFLRGWNAVCWISLALAVLTKIYPVILVPLLMIYLIKKGGRQKLIRGLAIFSLTIILISLPGFIISPSGFYDSFDYHAARGLQIESSGASLLLLGDVWSMGTQHPVFDYGAWELDGTAADILATLMIPLMLLVLGGLYYRYTKTQAQANVKSEESDLILYSTLAVMAFLLINKVFSPQYIIWLYPLIPLVMIKPREIIWIGFIIVGILTRYIFPDNYLDLVAIKPHMVYALVSRNTVLLGMLLLIWRRRNPSSPFLRH